MIEYWLNHFNTSAEKFKDSPLKQVGKTINGQEVSHEQVLLWADSVVKALSISENDSIADLCCGNGLITKIIAMSCKRIVGVDFSENLIRFAHEKNSADNIIYKNANAAELEEDFFSDITKVYMYESLQHLSVVNFEKLLKQIKASKKVEAFFIAGVPDIEKFYVFYDTKEKLAFEKERELAGKPHIGKWWSKTELCGVIERNGLKAAIITQGPELYCSHFRFDCLIERSDIN
jgi:2-polyprenyl-3-methyl-5-hydroxy-6-metoxy-1,4-benzoquinol methylase